MQALDVVERLRAFVPRFTSEFSNTQDITSLTVSGGLITATLPSHGYSTDDKITIVGAYEPITISSITRQDNIITITCSQPHKQHGLGVNEKRYIKIANATPVEYNGSFLLTEFVSDTILKAKITTTPTSPATDAGNLQLPNNEYNGYKTITVVDTDTFTYPVEILTPNSPAQGTIKAHTLNIKYGADIDIILDGYVVNNKSTLYQNTLAVVIEGSQVYNYNNITTTDISAMYDNMQSTGFRFYEVYPISIYMMLPKLDTQYAGLEIDFARRCESVIHKSILAFPFTRKNIAIENQQTYPCNYVNSEIYDVNPARYIHKMNYTVKTAITDIYSTDYINTVPLQEIRGEFGGLDLTVDTNQ